jgi:hypothetical protein
MKPALFAALAGGTDEPVVLTTLSGVDLCILGGTSGGNPHQVAEPAQARGPEQDRCTFGLTRRAAAQRLP